MKNIIAFIFIASSVVSVPVFAADMIEISAEQADTLGITTAKPVVAQGHPGDLLPAHVVIPSGNERVVSAFDDARVQTAAVAVGDEVKQGQILGTLASPALLSLQKDYLQAAAALNLSLKQLQRDRKLASEGVISKRRLQETEADYASREALATQQAASLRIAGFADADIEALRKSGKFTQFVPMRAPIGGVVLEQLANVGDLVSAGAPVFRIGDLSRLWLEIRVPVVQAELTEPGQGVLLEGRQAGGKVLLVGKYVDPASQTVLVRAAVESGLDQVRPGEMVSVRLVTGNTEAAEPLLRLPRKAVVRSGDKDYVFVKNQQGFVVHEVKLRGIAGDNVLIASGIAETDQVAISGIAALKASWMGMGGGE